MAQIKRSQKSAWTLESYWIKSREKIYDTHAPTIPTLRPHAGSAWLFSGDEQRDVPELSCGRRWLELDHDCSRDAEDEGTNDGWCKEKKVPGCQTCDDAVVSSTKRSTTICMKGTTVLCAVVCWCWCAMSLPALWTILLVTGDWLECPAPPPFVRSMAVMVIHAARLIE